MAQKVYLIGIAGTGMGAFAGLLKRAGFEVSGSDKGIYPPMSHKLKDWGIPIKAPFAQENVPQDADLIIVGNVASKDNIEAKFVREEGLKSTSFPAALYEMFLKKHRPVVVAGTHGKTTTASLLAHVLHSAQKDMGFLIGGIGLGFGESFHLPKNEQGAFFVVEGDEYDTAYFDKRPKFLHYAPEFLLCTSLEFDHGDIYKDLAHIQGQFGELFKSLKPGAQVWLCEEEPNLIKAFKDSGCKLKPHYYSAGQTSFKEDDKGIGFAVAEGELFVPMSGRHSLLNALGCYGVLKAAGLSFEEIKEGFASFKGVKRRMEVVGEVGGVTVVDDFAHHPSAVKTTLEGAKARFKGRPLWAIFEPRSATSCRKIFQEQYAQSFDAADQVLLAPCGRELPKDEALDTKLLVEQISKRGTPAQNFESIDDIVTYAQKNTPKNAVLLCMSNGGFGGVHGKLLTALE